MFGALLGSAIAVGSTLFAGKKASNESKKIMKSLEQQSRENDDWYNRRYNEDALQRADNRRILTQTKEAIRENNRSAAGRAAVTGATEESAAVTKEANARALASAASAISANADARKDNIEAQYRNQKANIEGQQNTIRANRMQQIAQAGLVGTQMGSIIANAWEQYD